jgi:hypothetical protein
VKRIFLFLIIFFALFAKTKVEVFDAYEDSKKTTNLYGLGIEYQSPSYKDTAFIEFKFRSIQDDDNESINSLEKAYIGLVDNSHHLKFGRFYLDSPFLNKDNFLAIPYSFKGLNYYYEDIFSFGVIDSVKVPLSNKFEKLEDKISFIGVKLKENNTKLNIYHYQTKPYNLTYIKIYGFLEDKQIGGKLLLGYERVQTSDKNFKIDSARVGIKKGSFGVIVAYLKNQEDSTTLSPVYFGKSTLFTHGYFNEDFSNQACVTSLRFKYDFLQDFFIRYIHNETTFKDKKVIKSNMVDLDYKNKNILFQLLYEKNEDTYLRANVNFFF